EMPRLKRVVGCGLLIGEHPFGGRDDRRRNVLVVEQRRIGREALFAHEFLVIEVAVLATLLGVTLRRNIAELPVERHGSSSSWFGAVGGDHRQLVNTLTNRWA